MDDWIVVPNWQKFQHYKHRDPPWIKNHRTLLANNAYLGLPMGARGLLHGIWLLYAEHNQELQVNDLHLLGVDRHRKEHLASLNDAGLLGFSASSVLAKTLCNSVSTKNTVAEPERDPDALLHIRELAAHVLGQRIR